MDKKFVPLTIRITPELLQSLRNNSKRRGISMNAYISNSLYMSEFEEKKKTTKMNTA